MKIQRVFFEYPEPHPVMSKEKNDRFKRVDDTIDQRRKEFDEVIDDVEARIGKLRKRTDEEYRAR